MPVPTPTEILAYTSKLSSVVGGPYSTDQGAAAAINIYDAQGKAYAWKADADIDSDGVAANGQANPRSLTDPWFQAQTSVMNKGHYMDPETDSFFVIPLPSSKFNYESAGIKLGAVGAVVYNGKVVYGTFADEGPANIIGEMPIEMADRLGINSDPNNGGVNSGVTYVAFKGAAAVPKDLQNQTEIDAIGQKLMADLLGQASLTPAPDVILNPAPVPAPVSGRTFNGKGWNDTIVGTQGNYKIYGLSGSDRLFGRNGDDQIDGGSGRDRIDGGLGNDILKGGANHDTFVFTSIKWGNDTIMDFRKGDVLQFSKQMVSSFSDLLKYAHDENGSTVIDVGVEQTVTLTGISASTLATTDFTFS
jgi:Ca2+-binding RTX toxin-like protein